MKRCIVHLPNKLNPDLASASQIRPKKMIMAFKKIGYEVDVVEGNSKDRSRIIRRIKKNIVSGVKYDFMYAESSTMPTLLTDSNHLPLHPFLDFGFFRFVKKHGIKIGLFYRDIYWKFPIYRENVKGIKGAFAVAMYKYDLEQYNKWLDILYMATERSYQYVNREITNPSLETLPPACEDDYCTYKPIGKTITLLYVGGLGKQYQIDKVLEVVKELKMYNLIICCREKEWQSEKERLEQYLSDNIQIVHKSGDELNALYGIANIGILLFKPDEYRKIAMPYKTFEYMGNGLPMIASSDTGVGDYVNQQGIGWTIPYNNSALKELLLALYDNRQEILLKSEACKQSIMSNKWTDRALKVQEGLA